MILIVLLDNSPFFSLFYICRKGKDKFYQKTNPELVEMPEAKFSLLTTGIPLFLTIAVGIITLKVLGENRFVYKLIASANRKDKDGLNDYEELNHFINPNYKPMSLQEAIEDSQRNANYKQDYEMIPMRASTIPISANIKVTK